jgi:proteasome accessory factor A
LKNRKLDAIEVQQFFCQELSRFVHENNFQTAETDEIFDRWNSVLRGLELDRQSIVGRVDWITKRFLLDELDASHSLAARRKVDLKYHELSPEVYYFRLAAAGVIEHLVTAEEIEQAMRLAPGKTRAAIRGRYIREFSGSQTDGLGQPDGQ